MILSTHGIVGSQIVQFSPAIAAQEFYDRVTAAGGSLTSTEEDAILDLIIDLNDAGIWTKMKAIYPMVGASSAACAQNLKSSSFTGTFNGGWTFSSTGATPNGSSGYMDTSLNDSTELALNSGSFGVYLNTFVNEKVPVLIYDGNNFVGTWLISRMVNTNVDVGFHGGLNNASGPSQNSGFYQISRNNSSQIFFRTNNVLQTRSINSVALVNRTFKLGTYDNNGSFAQFMINEARFFYIGDGLTTNDQSNFYTAVQAFQTTLSRNV